MYLLVCVCVCVCVSAGKTGLEKEQEFISKCMESLMMASANLEKDAHSSLTIIERGLLLLKTHLEAFRRRYTHSVAATARQHIFLISKFERTLNMLTECS